MSTVNSIATPKRTCAAASSYDNDGDSDDDFVTPPIPARSALAPSHINHSDDDANEPEGAVISRKSTPEENSATMKCAKTWASKGKHPWKCALIGVDKATADAYRKETGYTTWKAKDNANDVNLFAVRYT